MSQSRRPQGSPGSAGGQFAPDARPKDVAPEEPLSLDSEKLSKQQRDAEEERILDLLDSACDLMENRRASEAYELLSGRTDEINQGLAHSSSLALHRRRMETTKRFKSKFAPLNVVTPLEH